MSGGIANTGISYRDLAEMMLERGPEVDHTTLYRWVQHYAPEMEKRLRWHWKSSMGYSWRVDETYVKVKGSGHISTGHLIEKAI
ncbi:MAG: transposase [Nitrosospira multiformis]|nr:transposase [Nitrosospira multiformis]